jgi:hypothetical protein
MSSPNANRFLAAGVLAVVALAVAALVVVVGWDRGGPAEEQAARDPIAATGTLDPRVVLFGDTLTARVDVVVDRTVIDPDQVTVKWSAAPWKRVEPPAETRSAAGTTAYLRTTYVLRCLTALCAPARETEKVDLKAARVEYEAPVGEGTRRLVVDVDWPTLVVHTRVGELDADQRDALSAPWHADLVSLPAVSYRVAPGLAMGLLIALAALLVAIAAVVTYRVWPRRVPAPEPPPPPPPVVSALEQALALLENAAAANGAESRRRALELVADEVERLGDDRLANDARALAWSPDAPEGETTKAFAARLRSRMESLNGVPA